MKKIQCILLVDDDEMCNFVTEKMLEPLEICDELVVLMNGEEAADYFSNINGNKTPGLVLLDINMPLMNGFEFLEWYEASGYKGMTHIAMYSTSLRPEDVERSKKFEDVIGYIEKPLNKEKIERVLAKVS